MALLTFPAAETSSTSSTEAMKKKKQPPNSKRPRRPKQPKKQTSSWDQIKNLLTCKQIEGSAVRDPSSSFKSCSRRCGCGGGGGYSKLIMGSYSCSSICNFGDVAHSNTRVVHRADIISSPETTIKLHSPLKPHHLTSSNNLPSPLSPSTSSRRSPLLAASLRSNGSITTSSAAIRTASLRGMPVPLRKLSGCYECHMIVDPARCPKPTRERETVCVCSGCGEVFPKVESLELHRAIKHAVSELGPDDSGRNIVEIIFKSSWLKSDGSLCKIERILKVHNTQRTIQRFEHCRSAVKAHASNGTRKNPRCAADGNELLRFHCTTLTCALGAHGTSSLCCCSEPGAGGGGCAVCAIIRHGFEGRTGGVLTTASSGRAHDRLDGGGRRAMLVCRVIAGRVKRVPDGSSPGKVGDYVAAGGAYDSVAGHAGVYADLEDLVVLNPRAILPCFVVVYKALQP